MLDAALPSSAVDPVDGVDPPVPTGIVWDDALGEYDFGPFHPMAPIRLALTRILAGAAGVLLGAASPAAKPRRRPGIEPT